VFLFCFFCYFGVENKRLNRFFWFGIFKGFLLSVVFVVVVRFT